MVIFLLMLILINYLIASPPIKILPADNGTKRHFMLFNSRLKICGYKDAKYILGDDVVIALTHHLRDCSEINRLLDQAEQDRSCAVLNEMQVKEDRWQIYLKTTRYSLKFLVVFQNDHINCFSRFIFYYTRTIHGINCYYLAYSLLLKILTRVKNLQNSFVKIRFIDSIFEIDMQSIIYSHDIKNEELIKFRITALLFEYKKKTKGQKVFDLPIDEAKILLAKSLFDSKKFGHFSEEALNSLIQDPYVAALVVCMHNALCRKFFQEYLAKSTSQKEPRLSDDFTWAEVTEDHRDNRRNGVMF